MPTIQLQDRAPLTRTRKLADGRLAAVARFSRSGVYQYTGAELGRPDLGTVNVYRPESEVFDEAAMASFAHKAITLDHPGEAVTAANWRSTSRGWTEGKVARDGQFVEIPLMLADAEAVTAYESGRATELSAGYSCELIWGDGIAPDGTRYAAKQQRLRGNHIALVARGRAGPACSIGDSMFDAKAKPPASIDEALRQYFAAKAKSNGETVEAMLARMPQRDLEEAAADVAKQFVSALAGAGVAARYSDRSGLSAEGLACAEARGRVTVMKLDAARALREGAMGLSTAAFESTRAVRDAARAAQYDGSYYPSGSAPAPPSQASAVDNGVVRDLVRAARYRA